MVFGIHRFGQRVKAFKGRVMLKRLQRIALLFGAVVTLSACSKTVQWEEEVPLNTGEVILVKRTDNYDKRSEPGNPLQMVWWLNKRNYAFSWQGRQYTYETKVKTGGPILIHVFVEEKIIAIVDSAWPACAGYGEFRGINGSWHLQQNVAASIVGQPRNLMDYYSADDGAIPSRVTQEFIRNSRFDLPQNGGSLTHLPASKIAINCSRNK